MAELNAMNIVGHAVSRLSAESRARVLRWACEHFAAGQGKALARDDHASELQAATHAPDPAPDLAVPTISELTALGGSADEAWKGGEPGATPESLSALARQDKFVPVLAGMPRSGRSARWKLTRVRLRIRWTNGVPSSHIG